MYINVYILKMSSKGIWKGSSIGKVGKLLPMGEVHCALYCGLRKVLLEHSMPIFLC